MSEEESKEMEENQPQDAPAEETASSAETVSAEAEKIETAQTADAESSAMETESQPVEGEVPSEGAETDAAPEETAAAESETVVEDTPGSQEPHEEVASEQSVKPLEISEQKKTRADCPDDLEGPVFTDERIQRILDIEMPVNVSFGSTRRPLGEVLKLGPGALLELDRVADEPVVLKVNNKIFAKGEIVDVDGYYGVHITEISSAAQRIASLGDRA